VAMFGNHLQLSVTMCVLRPDIVSYLVNSRLIDNPLLKKHDDEIHV